MTEPRRRSMQRSTTALALAAGLALASAGAAGAQSVGGSPKGTGDGATGTVSGSSLGDTGAGGATNGSAGRSGGAKQGTTAPRGNVADQSGTGSLGAITGGAPVRVGGPTLDTASQGLRTLGSSEIADAGLSAATTLGSTGSLSALGSTSGSATASVASSGLVPGSVYSNPSGSIGSGTIGLGSVAVPEYAFGSLGLQLLGGIVGGIGDRQAEGDLDPAEIKLWHGTVVGSAQAGGTLEAAAAQAHAPLPPLLTGSIDSVRKAAVEDPFEASKRIAAQNESPKEKAAREKKGTPAPAKAPAASPAGAAAPARTVADPVADPAAHGGRSAAQQDAQAAYGTAGRVYSSDVKASDAPTVVAQEGQGRSLASTGTDAAVVAAFAVVALALGAGLVVASRRGRRA